MKRMLLSTTQQGALRVGILDGQNLIVDSLLEGDAFEKLNGNIYKGVIKRVDRSLEGYFVQYDEEKIGFLPFKERAENCFQASDSARTDPPNLLSIDQELIVQVKAEDGNRKEGMLLTSFISLTGPYLVLMPNSLCNEAPCREGERSRELDKIEMQLDVPEGMRIIVRATAIGRTVAELQWSLNYLTQLWKAIDEAAKEYRGPPMLIYLESSLVIRAIRDYLQPDISEIVIDTYDTFEQAHAFISVLMPSKQVQVKYYSVISDKVSVPLFSYFVGEAAYLPAPIVFPERKETICDHVQIRWGRVVYRLLALLILVAIAYYL